MSKLNDLLRDVAEETFESLAFMFPMPSDDEDAENADRSMVDAAVNFSGPFTGSVRLSIEQVMLAELAGNMLGVMDAGELTVAQQTDGFGELLNVVCGNLLPRLAGEEAVFDVHAPELLSSPGTPEFCGDDCLQATVELELDCGRAKISLYADADVEAVATAVG